MFPVPYPPFINSIVVSLTPLSIRSVVMWGWWIKKCCEQCWLSSYFTYIRIESVTGQKDCVCRKKYHCWNVCLKGVTKQDFCQYFLCDRAVIFQNYHKIDNIVKHWKHLQIIFFYKEHQSPIHYSSEVHESKELWKHRTRQSPYQKYNILLSYSTKWCRVCF